MMYSMNNDSRLRAGSLILFIVKPSPTLAAGSRVKYKLGIGSK
ncbi:Uncharacterised protein [Streptococcus pneumoniae]|nr:Uncharacterised protein [Streptococcus pneumoniae]